MKKLLLTTLISTLSIGVVHAEEPTLYGKINVSVGSIKDDLNKGTTTKVDSNSSRFGIKGSEKLNDSLSALYGIEWEVNVDGNASNPDLTARNRYAGLQYDGVGEIKIGKLDSYVKTAQNGIDIFDDLVDGNLDAKKTFAGEDRYNNVIALESAKLNLDGFGAVQANVLVAPGEKVKTNPTVTPAVTTTGANSIVSASGIYTNKDLGLYTALAYTHNAPSTSAAALNTFKTAPVLPATATSLDIWRWVGSVDLTKAGVDGLSLNALFQQAKFADSNGFVDVPKETSFLVSSVYKLPASVADGVSLKAQYQQSTTDIGTADDIKIQQFGGVVDYAFSAKTKVYGFYAKRNLKNPNNPVVSANGKDQSYAYSTFGVGLDQKF